MRFSTFVATAVTLIFTVTLSAATVPCVTYSNWNTWEAALETAINTIYTPGQLPAYNPTTGYTVDQLYQVRDAVEAQVTARVQSPIAGNTIQCAGTPGVPAGGTQCVTVASGTAQILSLKSALDGVYNTFGTTAQPWNPGFFTAQIGTVKNTVKSQLLTFFVQNPTAC